MKRIRDILIIIIFLPIVYLIYIKTWIQIIIGDIRQILKIPTKAARMGIIYKKQKNQQKN